MNGKYVGKPIEWKRLQVERIHIWFTLATGRKSECLVTLFSCYIIRACERSIDNASACIPIRLVQRHRQWRKLSRGQHCVQKHICVYSERRVDDRRQQQSTKRKTIRRTEMSCTDRKSMEICSRTPRHRNTSSWNGKLWDGIAEIIVINDINAFNCPLIRPFDAIALPKAIRFVSFVFTLGFWAGRTRSSCTVAQFVDSII